MRTGKPISSISYNSILFLKDKLDELIETRRIEFYAFINHLPEDDESNNKEHIHLYVEPAKLLQTVEFGQLFVEYNPDGRPFKCLPFHSSNFGHWYLYAIHDVSYLVSKGQERKYSYTTDDIVSSDLDYLCYKIKNIDMLKISPLSPMLEAQKNGLSFQEFFKRGSVPIQQLGNYMTAWELIKPDTTKRTYRNGRDNHENCF